MAYQQSEFNLDRHHCDLAVLKCIDFRFREADQKFIQETFGVRDFDLITWPGAAKAIVTDELMREQTVNVLKNVCIGLHGIKKLVILNHWDCGGYGGSKAFASAEVEADTYNKDLIQAKQLLETHLAGVEIILAFSRSSDSGLNYQVL
ncbi:MAG: carbonic anhydrase [Candidatus Komeilibacteria bacterium]